MLRRDIGSKVPSVGTKLGGEDLRESKGLRGWKLQLSIETCNVVVVPEFSKPTVNVSIRGKLLESWKWWSIIELILDEISNVAYSFARKDLSQKITCREIWTLPKNGSR